ncbi:MAG TPA: tripartite tricarboxylate transporter substrate binding protein, partial [Burkholderiales bacterium]|nr:tripartite tricarboxylate transporter substrate binding protein [Burkholderiales bacterium]
MMRIPRESAAALMITAAIAALVAQTVPAQTYPTRPIRMVVPFPPGAASDFLARVLGQKMGETWGQQVVVDNRPGAGGLIGGSVVAKSNPDGYTVALVGQPHLTAPLLSREPPWDPFKDFTWIGLVASMPNVAVVGPGLAVNSLTELLARVRERPGYYNFGSAGIGSSSHFAAEMFNSAARLQAVHVPFKLLGDAIAEMYGGRVHYYLFPLPAAMPALRDGKLKPIATGGRTRAVALPDVPPMSESGMPGFVSESYFGLVGPRGMTPTLVAKINGEAVRFLKTDELRNRYQQNGAEPAPSTPEQFSKLMQDEQARVKKII